jgi:hypothetical protein
MTKNGYSGERRLWVRWMREAAETWYDFKYDSDVGQRVAPDKNTDSVVKAPN